MRHEHALQPDEKLWTTVIRALAKLCVTGGGSGERSPSIDSKRPLSLLEQALSDMRSAGFVPSMSLYPTTTTATISTKHPTTAHPFVMMMTLTHHNL
jgi:hypothetical protein